MVRISLIYFWFSPKQKSHQYIILICTKYSHLNHHFQLSVLWCEATKGKSLRKYYRYCKKGVLAGRNSIFNEKWNVYRFVWINLWSFPAERLKYFDKNLCSFQRFVSARGQSAITMTKKKRKKNRIYQLCWIIRYLPQIIWVVCHKCSFIVIIVVTSLAFKTQINWERIYKHDSESFACYCFWNYYRVIAQWCHKRWQWASSNNKSNRFHGRTIYAENLQTHSTRYVRCASASVLISQFEWAVSTCIAKVHLSCDTRNIGLKTVCMCNENNHNIANVVRKFGLIFFYFILLWIIFLFGNCNQSETSLIE